MAEILARGKITIAVISDGYTLSLTTQSVSIPIDSNTYEMDLSKANTRISLFRGDTKQKIEISKHSASHPEVEYKIDRINDYEFGLTLKYVPDGLSTGYVQFTVKGESGYETTAKFNFTVIPQALDIDWIREWNTNKTQIGKNYAITPKLFVGHKTDDGKVTGVYIGKVKGFIGQILPYTFGEDPEEGLYGYRDDKVVFYINNYGAKIGGWNINPSSISIEKAGKTMLISSDGAISSSDAKTTYWTINQDGSASFAKGNVKLNADGSAEFTGKITAESGLIGGWTIKKTCLSHDYIALDAAQKCIAVANGASAGQNACDLYKTKGGVAMYYTTAHDYGIVGINTDKKQVFHLGSSNFVGPWNFDTEALYKGTKVNTLSKFTASGDLTMGTNGIRSFGWCLDSNGAGRLANGNISWDKSGNVTFAPSVKLNWQGGSSAAFMMASGKMMYRDPEFIGENFNGTWVYLGDSSCRAMALDSLAPNSTGRIMRFQDTKWYTVGDARIPGFYFANKSRANARYVVRILAKIPLNWHIENYHNAHGDGATQEWVTPTMGTGKYEEYVCIVRCGASGNFSTVNYIALGYVDNDKYTAVTPSANNNLAIVLHNKETGRNEVVSKVEWDVAYATVFDASFADQSVTTIDASGIYTGTIKANQISAGYISAERLNLDELLSNKNAWALKQDGSGYLANKNIQWDASGKVTFSESVSLLWSKPLSDMSGTIQGVQQSIAATNQNVGNVVRDLEAANKNIQGVTKNIETANKNISTANQNIAAANKNIETVTNNLATANQNINTVTKNLGTANQSITSLQSGLQTTNNNVQGLSKDLGQTNQNVQSLSNGLANTDKNIQKTNQTVSGINSSLANVLKDVQTITGNVNTITTDLEKLEIKGTYITDTGVYSGTMAAENIIAGTLAAGVVYSGTIAANKITAGTLATGVIYTGHIAANQIDADELLSNQNAWALKQNGSGYLANKNIQWDASGNVTFSEAITLQWSQPIGNIVQSVAGVSQKVDNVNKEVSGIKGKTTKIDANGVYTGTIEADQIKADDLLSNGNAWAFKQDGSGYLANKNIQWNTKGDLTFSEKVRLIWKEDVDVMGQAAICMSQGTMIMRNPEFKYGAGDLNFSVNAFKTWTDHDNEVIALSNIADSTAPNSTGRVMKVSMYGGTSIRGRNLHYVISPNNTRRTYYMKYVAKIPTGMTIHYTCNVSCNHEWLTSTNGTGDWATYICKVDMIKPAASMALGIYFMGANAGTSSSPLVCLFAYGTIFDAAESEKLYTTITKDGVYTGEISASQITSGLIKAGRIDVDNLLKAKNGAWILKQDGSGRLADGGIEWDTDGNLSMNGSITATGGKIGGLTIGTDDLHYGDMSNWGAKELKTQIRPGIIKLQDYKTFDGGSHWLFNRLFMGRAADPAHGAESTTFLYLERESYQNTSWSELFQPAFTIKSTNGGTPYVSIRSTGCIVVDKGGFWAANNQLNVSRELSLVEKYKLDLHKGSIHFLKNTSGRPRDVYVDLSWHELGTLMGGITSYVAELTVINDVESNSTINLRFNVAVSGTDNSMIAMRPGSIHRILIIGETGEPEPRCIYENRY